MRLSMNLREIVHNYSPLKHFLYALFFVLTAFFVSVKFGLKISEYDEALKANYFNWNNFPKIVLYEPIKEELEVRFLPWLMLVAMMILSRANPIIKEHIEKSLIFGLSISQMVFWIPILILNVCWAADHAWPLIVFVMGVIMGCIIFYTREVYCAIFGILLTTAFHILFNFFVFFGAITKIHYLQ